MSTLEVWSVSLNVVLAFTCFVVGSRACRRAVIDAVSRRMVQQEAEANRRQADGLLREYLSFGQSVAETLQEVRQDINRNYQHTHDGHLLDRIAYAFETTRGPIVLDDFLSSEIRKAGAAEYTVDGKLLLFSGALKLAWDLHAQARKNAGELFAVTQESCGHTDTAAWLGKTLALYQRICDGDKGRAIESLGVVLERWRHWDVQDAVHYATYYSSDRHEPLK